MRRWRAKPIRALLSAGALVLLSLTVGACGPPDYRYEASQADDLVMRVPRSWTMVKSGVPAKSDGTAGDAGSWLAVFDAADHPSIDHAQANHAAAPVALAETAVVTKEKGASLSDDTLRDVFLPVSEDGRKTALLAGFSGTGFKLMSDATINSKTAHGVHIVFTYDLNGQPEVFDQIAVADASKTRVHLLLVHCTKACYESHSSDITATVRSFTVKTP